MCGSATRSSRRGGGIATRATAAPAGAAARGPRQRLGMEGLPRCACRAHGARRVRLQPARGTASRMRAAGRLTPSLHARGSRAHAAPRARRGRHRSRRALGHSDGASIALLAAAAAPARVHALVLEAPHVFVEPLSLASIGADARALRDDRHLRARLARHHAHVDEAFQGWNDVWLDPDFKEWNIEAACRAWPARRSCCRALDDEYGTWRKWPRHPAAWLAGQVRTRLIQNCGHSPHRDHPSVVLDEAPSFLDR